jgi:hypothetical protein
MGFTQSLTEMSTRRLQKMFLRNKVRPVRRANEFLRADCLDNVGSLTSHNPIGLHSLLRVSFTLWRRSVLPVRYELDCKYCYK